MSDDKPNKWRNALRRDIEWTKEDLSDVIYWIRQWLGLIVGIAFGVGQITGFVGHIGFVLLNGLLLYVYYAKYLRVDDEELGRWDLLSEGFGPSYGMFLLAWITTYSVLIEITGIAPPVIALNQS